MRYYKVYGSSGSTTANLANVQMVKSGRVKTVKWSNAFDSVTDNSRIVGELSIQPTSVVAQNDSRGPIDQFEWLANGTAPLGFQNDQSLVDVPIAAGERLYLNVTVTGTVTGYFTCIVGVEE